MRVCTQRLWGLVLVTLVGVITLDCSNANVVAPVSPSPSIATSTTQPTLTPLPTGTATFTRPTLAPTALPPLLRATPAMGADEYKLSSWTETDALKLIELMEVYWHWIDENDPGYHWVNANGGRKYVAIAAQEALLRFPTISQHESLEWEIAWSLARAGDQSASPWIAQLIERSLNEKVVSLKHLEAWDKLQGFYGHDQPQLLEAHNLFADNREAYVLKIGALDGAAFAIQQNANGVYLVQPIASFWETAHESGFEVAMGDYNSNDIPEVAVSQSVLAGSGPSFGFTDFHIYQWQGGTWRDLTKTGLSVSGFAHWGDLSTDKIVIETIPNSAKWPFCLWKMTFTFTWDGEAYTQKQTHIEVPSRMQSPVEMICMEEVWDWAVSERVFTSTITLMENTLQNWPSPETDLGDPFATFQEEFGPAYPDFFEFQLGRFYALAGKDNQAALWLRKVIALPANSENSRARTLARLYLDQLANTVVAEKNIAGLLKAGEGLPTHYPIRASDTPVSLVPNIGQIESLIFWKHAPQSAIPLLEAAAPTCRWEVPYEPLDCARLRYLLGLAYELSGDEKKAVPVYWQLWHDYPNSLYMVMARLKLQAVVP